MKKAVRPRKRPFPAIAHDHARCIADAVDAAARLCEQEGQRLTPLRRRVLELVWTGHQPVGAYALLDRLKGDGRSAAPPTVYRALEFLLERGLIHRIESLNAYVGCADPGTPHLSQFLICSDCGTAAEVEDRRVAEAIVRSAADSGFKIQGRVIELKGLCPDCQRSAVAHGA